jgi:DNA repair exonuclease SbcCD ATPase subunit
MSECMTDEQFRELAERGNRCVTHFKGCDCWEWDYQATKRGYASLRTQLSDTQQQLSEAQGEIGRLNTAYDKVLALAKRKEQREVDTLLQYREEFQRAEDAEARENAANDKIEDLTERLDTESAEVRRLIMVNNHLDEAIGKANANWFAANERVKTLEGALVEAKAAYEKIHGGCATHVVFKALDGALTATPLASKAPMCCGEKMGRLCKPNDPKLYGYECGICGRFAAAALAKSEEEAK